MALPKRRFSKSRRDKRRLHIHLTAPTLVRCSQCGVLIRSHRVCPACGTYRRRQVLPVQEKKPKSP